MGLTAIVSSAVSSSSTSVVSLLSPVGLGVGGAFVAAALVFLLAYYDVLDAGEETRESLRLTLLATIVPLGLAFAGVVLFQTLTAL